MECHLKSEFQLVKLGQIVKKAKKNQKTNKLCGLIFDDSRVRRLFSSFVSTVLDDIGNKATQNLCQNKGK